MARLTHLILLLLATSTNIVLSTPTPIPVTEDVAHVAPVTHAAHAAHAAEAATAQMVHAMQQMTKRAGQYAAVEASVLRRVGVPADVIERVVAAGRRVVRRSEERVEQAVRMGAGMMGHQEGSARMMEGEKRSEVKMEGEMREEGVRMMVHEEGKRTEGKMMEGAAMRMEEGRVGRVGRVVARKM